jgi:hypothetical protein
MVLKKDFDVCGDSRPRLSTGRSPVAFPSGPPRSGLVLIEARRRKNESEAAANPRNEFHSSTIALSSQIP